MLFMAWMELQKIDLVGLCMGQASGEKGGSGFMVPLFSVSTNIYLVFFSQ